MHKISRQLLRGLKVLIKGEMLFWLIIGIVAIVAYLAQAILYQ